MADNITKGDLDKLVDLLNNSQDDESLTSLGSIKTLLELPDDQFSLLAPGVLQAFQQAINNPTDQLLLAQSFNVQGVKKEDLINIAGQIDDVLEKSNLSKLKRDFSKQIIDTVVNAINESKGIAKRILSIPVEVTHPDAKIPQYAHLSDSGADIFALEDIVIKPGETKLISTGLKLALPPGYEIQIRPKSGRSLQTKLRIANTPATIDAGYRDEIKVIIENVDPPIKELKIDENGKVISIEYGKNYYINKGEKFAQLVLSEVPKMALYRIGSITKIEGEDRKGGFGSTGLK